MDAHCDQQPKKQLEKVQDGIGKIPAKLP